jgi:hypothetical protein
MTYLDALALMLRLEHDLLNRFDPFVPSCRSVHGERVIALRSPQLETCIIYRVAAGEGESVKVCHLPDEGLG